MNQRTGIYLIVIFFCLGIALLFEWVLTPPPSEKKIHIETFRYGTSPSIIRANRGDKLTLTFSTRDTAHSFFLQDYHMDVKISPAGEVVEVRNPFRTTLPPSYTREVHLKAGLSGVWGHLVSISRFRCHVYCGPMHGFEQGDLIVRPNWLMAGSLGLLMAIIVVGLLGIHWDSSWIHPHTPAPIDLNRRSLFINKLLKWRPLQFVLTLPVLAGLMIVLMAGIFGTKIGGRNIASTLTWIVWISMLTIVLIPLGGRIWCMICPLPVLGEYMQRGATTQVRPAKKGRSGNHFLGLGKPWPRALRGPWLRLLLFLALGTFSASLAGQPGWTAAAILLMVIMGIFMSLVWELRSFCRFVCPVASFISSYSAVGHLMVRNRDAQTCRNCRETSCLRGNANGWACPYGLSVPGIKRNTDCGLCTECFKSCPHDNVSLGWRRGAWSDGLSSYGEAWQIIVLLVLAVLYSLTVHSPWWEMRDMVNVVDKASWPEFGLYAAVLWIIALGVAPLIFWMTSGFGLWLSEHPQKSAEKNVSTEKSVTRHLKLHKTLFSTSVGRIFKNTMPALIPFGLALWAAFFIDTIMVNFTFIWLGFSDPFGWGWDLFGTAGMPWVQIWPSGVPWIQAGLTLSGVFFSLKKGYWLWQDVTPTKTAAVKGFAPTASVLITLATGMLVYFTNY